MFFLSLLAGGLGLAQLCISTPLNGHQWDDFVGKHAWEEIPQGWEYHSPAPDNHLLEMRIGLKQDKLDELISTMYEVSDPAHERCVHHLLDYMEKLTESIKN
jgi:tripeptidyl-peptidase-1